MEGFTNNKQIPDVPTTNGTFSALESITSPMGHLPSSFIRTAIFIIFLLLTHRIIRYLTSELPPRGSNLKPLPGPLSTLPYIGRIHDVDRNHAWSALHKFSRQYNGLFSCTLGGETHIWVAREDVAQDLLCKNAAICSARADLGSYPGVTKGFKYLPLLGYTDAFLGQLGPSGPVMNLVPPLMHLPEWLVPGKREVRLRQEREAKLWEGLFDRSKDKYKKGGYPKTYVGASLESKDGSTEGKLLFENETEAKYAVGMLCTVGIFTIAGPAILFIMAMILHPEWQEKVRAQIDEVVGDEMIDLKHSPRLPILRAVIKECVRWKSTVPLGVPRLLSSDYTYDNYHFPAGAVVHVLDIALSQDPKRYQNPSTYDPDRWLNPTSRNFKAPLTEFPRLKGHHIFGRGKRACPGQDLAEAELFVFCGNLLKFFTLSPALDEKDEPIWPDPDKWTTNVIGGPLPFDCRIEVRDKKKLDMVEKMYSEAFEKNI
ncbi:hypothetical protein N0V83_002706 [Neocucurbitaria cava]|uniref:Cytochrome P450 n=1 Tax=Neocucurbitaria cava TaxID=798079 RepID=A0A9W9CPS1_9PLEO|nr:hypothetical protein N0V83_002706 [Neocucurbitaria cava]